MGLKFDVVVIGGGHAGCEAAAAAARMGRKVGLFTQKLATLGTMSCNPAIGGLGKGHLVREIDALDGLMGRAADRAGIHFKLLNRSKGPAVRGPRAQADRKLYRAAVQALLRQQESLRLLEGTVVDIRPRGRDGTLRVVLEDGHVDARCVVLTTGTFLGGKMFIGDQVAEGGRVGEGAANGLAGRLRNLGLPMGRLKTGTPPRLDGRSIDFAVLQAQWGDETPVFLSTISGGTYNRQVACYLTRTTTAAHDLIRANLAQSPMYSGAIQGTGPRYCPSIEDKVVRFPDRDGHQVFLEPEGLGVDVVYPNGISTALPVEVQVAFVRMLPGLGQVRVVQPGYAVEYDYVDPRCLGVDLSLSAMPGLYLAGQINGTTGYEEAAAQGIYAGINAARAVEGESPFVLDRGEAYIGVLVDDLVQKGVSEPYRMFTSRAEYRLCLRIDNADQRLTRRGLSVGCVGSERRGHFLGRMAALERARGTPIGPEFEEVPQWAAEVLAAEATYAGYLDRQARDIEAYRRDEALVVSKDLDYSGVPGLSNEVRSIFSSVRPGTIGQAARLSGVTPSAVNILLRYVHRTPGTAG